MPNTFAPRAFETVVKDRTEALRMEHEGDRGEIKEWHGIIDLLGPEGSKQFVAKYGKVDDIPAVVDIPRDGE